MNMEFLNSNYVNTTTQMSVSAGGTSSVGYLFNRFTSKKFGSGDASDATTTTITITFNTTLSVERIALQNINLKSFKLYYNTTTSLFSMTSGLTGTSSWTNNSATSIYMICTPANVKTLYIIASTTISANEEKQIGELWVTKQLYQFINNPGANEYKPVIARKDYDMNMSDGGVNIYRVQNNFQAKFNLKYIDVDDKNNLKDMYDLVDHFVFVPEPTGTAWNGDIWAVNWVGDFGFAWTRDFKDTGYDIGIDIREIPK